MSPLLVNIAVVLFFILLGGFFAAAEMALVSLRESQVTGLSARGSARPGRGTAAQPSQPVPVGGADRGHVLRLPCRLHSVRPRSPTSSLRSWRTGGLPDGAASAIALVSITLVIAYLSLVLGRARAETSRAAAGRGLRAVRLPPIAIEVWRAVSKPLIWLLSKSTDVVVRLAGGDPKAAREQMSELELRDLVVGHSELDDEERQLLGEVFTANDQQLREVMVPRTEVDFLDAGTPVFKAIKDTAKMPHSRYPVIRGICRRRHRLHPRA